MTDFKHNLPTPSGEPDTSLKSSSSDLGSSLRKKSLRSIRFEMSVIFVVILAAILIVFSGVIYGVLSTTVYRELDYEIKFQALEISDNINLYLSAKKNEPNHFEYALKAIISREVKLRQWWGKTDFERRWEKKVKKQDLSHIYINFATPQGQSLQASSNIEEPLLGILNSKIRVPELDKDDFFNVKFRGHVIRVGNYSFVGPGGQTYVLQVGLSQEPAILILQDWMHKVALSIPIILILMSFMGGLMANRILRPIEQIAAMARDITQADLSKRVESEAYYQEMDPVIDAFNGMIARLEKSFHHIRNFSSHIAHELKTPLTILRGETELTLMVPRTAEEYQETLNTNLEETQTMLRIIDDLLFFTRMEHHPGLYKFAHLELLTYLKEITKQGVMLAKRKNVTIDCQWSRDSQIFIHADAVHLRRMFLNLIDNAIKYSPENGRVDIIVTLDASHVVIRVKDYGRGISKKDASKIFDLFYSADTISSGNGLGLSIAQVIAKVHGGIITVVDQPHGSVGAEFMLTLPVVQNPAEVS